MGEAMCYLSLLTSKQCAVRATWGTQSMLIMNDHKSTDTDFH